MKKREQTITYPAQFALQTDNLSAIGKEGMMCPAKAVHRPHSHPHFTSRKQGGKIHLEKFSGPEFSRGMAPATGLPLWPVQNEYLNKNGCPT